MIVSKDGKAAVNFEHSWGDGVAVMRFINESLKNSTEKPSVHPNQVATMGSRVSLDPSHHVKRLGNKNDNCLHRGKNVSLWLPRLKSLNLLSAYVEFQLSDQIKAAIGNARKRFDQVTNGLAVDLFIYEGFSKQFCKDQQVSPDAMMQLGFQVKIHCPKLVILYGFFLSFCACFMLIP